MQIINDRYKLYLGDCLDIMDKLIMEGVQVDAIITDPPYGSTHCAWDVVIPFNEMWERLYKLIKPNGGIILFGTQPFTTNLIYNNINNFKYTWVWHKKNAGNFINVQFQPLRTTEDIIVFSRPGESVNYYPIMSNGKQYSQYTYEYNGNKNSDLYNKFNGGTFKRNENSKGDKRYPKHLIEFSNANRKNQYHPTQKPIPLMEYLIITYTRENETVLDFTMGSGSTGVAALNNNRQFIGIELDEHYFNIAVDRLQNSKQENNKNKNNKQRTLF